MTVKKIEIQQLGSRTCFSAITAADGWSELDRGQDGKITASKKRFPSGIQHVSDYVHSKGTNFTPPVGLMYMHAVSNGYSAMHAALLK